MKMATNSSKEILLSEEEIVMVIFPIKRVQYGKCIKRQNQTFGRMEEIDLTKGHKDYNEKLNENERYFINNVLAFFAASMMVL